VMTWASWLQNLSPLLAFMGDARQGALNIPKRLVSTRTRVPASSAPSRMVTLSSAPASQPLFLPSQVTLAAASVTKPQWRRLFRMRCHTCLQSWNRVMTWASWLQNLSPLLAFMGDARQGALNIPKRLVSTRTRVPASSAPSRIVTLSSAPASQPLFLPSQVTLAAASVTKPQC
nr:hypothetical protein [Tanacetum cinerariifolium]